MKYKKKPVVVDAFLWTGAPTQPEDPEWMIEAIRKGIVVIKKTMDPLTPKGVIMTINTLEGVMKAELGDYIIKGVKGELYPCKPDIFEATYEKVEEESWKDRLKKETEELSEKVNKLHDFFKTEAFHNLDRPNKDLLYSQHNYMMGYLQILGKRCELNEIKLFEKEGEK